jgi:translation initiation factor 3 subunit B
VQSRREGLLLIALRIYLTGTSHRFMFLTYPSPAEATAALRNLDQYLFGKNRLQVNKFGDIERYASLPIEEGSVPRGWVEESEIEPQEHLKSWLADPQGRDQYLTYRGESVDLNWIGRGGAGEPAVQPEPVS